MHDFTDFLAKNKKLPLDPFTEEFIRHGVYKNLQIHHGDVNEIIKLIHPDTLETLKRECGNFQQDAYHQIYDHEDYHVLPRETLVRHAARLFFNERSEDGAGFLGNGNGYSENAKNHMHKAANTYSKGDFVMGADKKIRFERF